MSTAERHGGTLRTETTIGAPVEVVWPIIADLPGWPSWTRVLHLDETQLEADAVVHVWVARGSAHERDFYGTITDVEPFRRLAWEGGDPDTIHARHVLTLAPGTDATTTVTHEQVFAGQLLEDARQVSHDGEHALTQELVTFNADLRSRAETEWQIGGAG